MKNNFGERIRKYRRERDLTQDELAQAVGVTYQSVSKWERGEGYPDIMLLPRIARFFGVTVDELLGNDRTDEIIDEYERESAEYRRAGDMDADLALWEKAYAEYPEDIRVISNLSNALLHGKNPDEDNMRAASLCEKILEMPVHFHYRDGAIQRLCMIYVRMGDREKALHYADIGGNHYTSALNLRCRVLDGEEGVKACQDYITVLVRGIYAAAGRMLKKVDYPPEKAIEIYQFIINVYRQLFSDGNVLFYSYDLAELYKKIAGKYAEMKDGGNTIQALRESGKYAVIKATLPEEGEYTAAMVDRVKFEASKITKDYKGNACNILREYMGEEKFDFVREDDGFKAVLDEIEKYAEKI